jgi:hypothetical protein
MTTVNSKLFNKGINKLLSENGEPQDGCFISGYDLVEISEWEQNLDTSGKSIDYILSLLKSETKSFIISEGQVFGDEEETDVEELFSVDNLLDTTIEIPEGFKSFMLLPVDYNRGGDDIVITFFTELGAELFNGKFTGDY